MNPKKATLCACKTKHWIPAARLAEAAYSLKSDGYDVKVVDNLCRTAMEVPDELKDIAQTLVIACHHRAVTNLFRWRGVEAERVANLRSLPTQEALKDAVPEINWQTLVETVKANSDGLTATAETTPSAGTINEGWFPVIDKQQCVNCGRCMDFCLFGVYSKVGNQIVVAQPDKCKNNCPACARMCPERAIIFPKYDKSPINGGLEEEETFSAESMEAIYNERLRYKLQERRQSVSLLKKPQ